MRRVLPLLLALAGTARAEPRPTLDDFYDRTRDRDDGFDDCLGYCEGQYLAGLLVGVQTATSEDEPASGGRLGVDLGMRGGYADVARTKLWADVLRVHESGDWLADLAWQTTAFKAFGDIGDAGAHVSFDSLVERRTELEPSDFAELQRAPFSSVDVESEVAATGGMIDKDGFLAIPFGVANRLRWSEGGRLERRTSVSGAIALRGFPRRLRHHLQLDFLRIKRTEWAVAAGNATAWTVSAGYQRLSPDIDWLQIWLLAGYERAGDRHGPIVQLGAEITIPTERGVIELGPRLEEHLALDPLTVRFTRIYNGQLYVRHRIGPVRWGVAYEAVVREDARLHAITPELGIGYRGLELGVRYRLAQVTKMEAAPTDRLQLTLDRRF
jgi:hypothetical protein